MCCRVAAFSCLLLIPAILAADVTLRYQIDYKLNPSLPPAVSQVMSTARLAPSSIAILIKGNKSRSAAAGMTSITDLSAQTITLLDATHQHFATVPVSQFADDATSSMPKMPAAAQGMLAAMKVTADSRATGRTAEIQGIQAEERELVLSMSMSMGPEAPATPVMKLVMQLWLAKPDDAARNPALREFMASGLQQMKGMNPAETLQKLLAQFPGMGDSLSKFMDELTATHSVTLRMHTEVFMPVLAIFSQRMPAGNNPLTGVDPNAALMTMDEEIAELSTTPVDEALFRIPDGYTAVPLSDILAANLPKAATPPAPIRPAIAPAEN